MTIQYGIFCSTVVKPPSLRTARHTRLANLTSRHGSLPLAALGLPLSRHPLPIISTTAALRMPYHLRDGARREEPGARQHAQAASGRYDGGRPHI